MEGKYGVLAVAIFALVFAGGASAAFVVTLETPNGTISSSSLSQAFNYSFAGNTSNVNNCSLYVNTTTNGVAFVSSNTSVIKAGTGVNNITRIGASGEIVWWNVNCSYTASLSPTFAVNNYTARYWAHYPDATNIAPESVSTSLQNVLKGGGQLTAGILDKSLDPATGTTDIGALTIMGAFLVLVSAGVVKVYRQGKQGMKGAF